MIIKLAGVWCKSKNDFDSYVKSGNYDLSISYLEIYTRLLKNDPGYNEPSDTIISLYIQNLFTGIDSKFQDKEEINIAFLFKNLDSETVCNLKEFILSLFPVLEIELVVINREDYPKKGVLNLFDSVKFIDND